MPEDEFDLDAAIAGAKNVVAQNTDDFDLDSAIANVKGVGADAIAAARAKAEELLPYGEKPEHATFVPEDQVDSFLRPDVGSEGNLPWYRQLVTEPIRRVVMPTGAERTGDDAAFQEQANRTGEAAQELTDQVRTIGSGPAEAAKFAGRTALGIGGQYAGGLLGAAPAASPFVRTALGAAAGGVSAGTDAAAHGASLPEVAEDTGMGMLYGGGATGAMETAALSRGAGAKRKSAANTRLATTAYPSRELDRIRTRGGDEGVAQAGQNLRDAGATRNQGWDRLSQVTPQVMSRNVTREMNAARAAGEGAEDSILDAFAGGQRVGDTNVDVSPVHENMTRAADKLRYEKASPEGPSAYEEARDRFTTPYRPKGPPERFPQPTPDAGDIGLPPPPSADSGQTSLIFPQPAPYPRAPMPEAQTPLPLGSSPRPAVQEELPLPVSEPRPQPPAPSPAPVPDPEQLGLGLSRGTPQQQDFGFEGAAHQLPLTGAETVPRARPEPFGSTGGSQMGLDFNAPAGQLNIDFPSSRANMTPVDPGLPANYPQRPPMAQQELPLPGQQDLPFPPGEENLLASPAPSTQGQPELPFNRQRGPASQLPLEFSRNEQQLELPLEGQQGLTFPASPSSAPPAPPPPAPVPEQGDLPFYKYDQPAPAPPAPVQRDIPFEPGPGTQMDLPLPGQQSLPFPPRTPSGSEENLLNSPISNDQLPMYYGGYNPPGSANAAQPASPVNRAPSPPSEQLGLPLEEHPRTGYTLRELVDSTRRAGKEASPSFHGGSKLNKAPTYATEAQSELYQAGKKLVNSEFDKSIEHGYADPSDVATRRSANTKFSTLATVAPNVAKQANQANRAAARPASGNDTIFGAQKRIAHGLLDRATGGVNSQYAIGQGLEGVGTAAEAGSQLARLGAGLGWTNPDQEHPEMAKVVSENPQAPKAAVEAKTNDKMKQSLMGSWYTSLVDTAKGLFD